MHNDVETTSAPPGLGLSATAYGVGLSKALQDQAAADRQKMVDELVAAGEADPAEAEQVIDRVISVLAQHTQAKRAPELVQENRADRRRRTGGRRSRRRLR